MNGVVVAAVTVEEDGWLDSLQGRDNMPVPVPAGRISLCISSAHRIRRVHSAPCILLSIIVFPSSAATSLSPSFAVAAAALSPPVQSRAYAYTHISVPRATRARFPGAHSAPPAATFTHGALPAAFYQRAHFYSLQACCSATPVVLYARTASPAHRLLTFAPPLTPARAPADAAAFFCALFPHAHRFCFPAARAPQLMRWAQGD